MEEMTKLIDKVFEYVTDKKIRKTTCKIIFGKKESWRPE